MLTWVMASETPATVLMARIKDRCSVSKSISSASWRMVEDEAGSLVVRAFLLAASQRSDTPFASRASAIGGRRVSSEASSTSSVSVLLQAAGYEVFESTMTLTAMAGSAVCSR